MHTEYCRNKRLECHVMTDERNFFDQPIRDDIKT